jgi:mono/diheme cytochrome c family protein
MLKLVLSISAATIIAITAVTAIAASAGPASPVEAQNPDSIKDVYMSNCQMCHGPDGISPIKDMSFVGRKWKTKSTAEAVKVISKGVAGTVMQPFEGKLKKDQIAALAVYVRSLDTPEARKKK